MSDQLQFRRKVSLLVAKDSGDALDLSGLRITFDIKESDSQTPNDSIIRVYNLAEETETRIQKEYTRIIFQAGYDSNFGEIFNGNIKEVKTGKEAGTDTYLELICGDGDDAYNNATVNTTLAAGATQKDVVEVVAQPMYSLGLKAGQMDDVESNPLPRGKVCYGMSRDYLRSSAETTQTTWSIQRGKIQNIKKTGALTVPVVNLSAQTGIIGDPIPTTGGLRVKCLLNPFLKIGGLLKVEANGVNRILTITFKGDTRGNDWYAEMECLTADLTKSEGNQVKLNG